MGASVLRGLPKQPNRWQVADDEGTMAGDQGSIRQQSDCLCREEGNKRRRVVQSMKRGAGKREEHTEAHGHISQTRAEQSSTQQQQHMGGAFSLSLLLLAPMYQIPALETHKPAQLPTSTPRLSFISPFSLMPSFSALFPHRLSSSDPVVVVLLPFVATTAMFPDSINTPALATTSETPPPSQPWGSRGAGADGQSTFA